MALQSYLTNFINNLGGFQNGNAYVGGTLDSSGVTMQDPLLGGHGLPPRFMINTIALLAADNAGSTYLLHKNVSADDILEEMWLEVDAMSGLTSVSIGIFDSLLGTPIQVGSEYMLTTDLHLGSTKLLPFDGLVALTHQSVAQTVGALAGKTLTNQNANYDIVLTAVTAPVQAGSITARTKLTPSG
jgi:hypothetical protein